MATIDDQESVKHMADALDMHIYVLYYMYTDRFINIFIYILYIYKIKNIKYTLIQTYLLRRPLAPAPA